MDDVSLFSVINFPYTSMAFVLVYFDSDNARSTMNRAQFFHLEHKTQHNVTSAGMSQDRSRRLSRLLHNWRRAEFLTESLNLLISQYF